jgi:hypothetical protein
MGALIGCLGLAVLGVALVMLVVKAVLKKGWEYKKIGVLAVVALALFVIGLVITPSTKENFDVGREAGRKAATEADSGSLSQKAGIVEPKWKTYSSDEYEFSYPSSWIVVNPEEIGMEMEPSLEFEFIIYPSLDEETNINLVIETFPFLAPSAKEQADSAEELLEILGSGFGIKNYKQVEFTTLKVGNIEAGVSTNEYIISQNNLAVKNQQLIVPLGQKSYILTLTCAKDEWEVYEADFQKLINSFKLK